MGEALDCRHFDSGLFLGSSNVFDELEPKASLAEMELNLTGVADDANGTVNDVLQNCFQAPASHLDIDGRQVRPSDDLLADHSQDIQGKCCAQHDDLVHAKFTGRQLLDPEVTLELAMELLTGAVVVIQMDDFQDFAGQVRPIGVHLDLR